MFNFTGFPSLVAGMVEVEGEEALGRMVVPEGSASSAGADLLDVGTALIRAGQAGVAGDSGTGRSPAQEPLPVAGREVAEQESQEPLGESVVQNKMV